MKKLTITLKRGYPGLPEKQRRILQALGLRKRHQTVTKDNLPSIRGMVTKVVHLVEIKETE